MEHTVKFISTTQAKYDALVSKDAGSLYFTSDTHRIYKGSELFSISDVSNLATKSDATLTERGFGPWSYTGMPDGWTVKSAPQFYDGRWSMVITNGDIGSLSFPTSGAETDAEVAFAFQTPESASVIASRTALPGCILGPDDPSNPNRDKSLATASDATLNERGPNHDGFSAWQITWVNPAYPNPIDGVTWYYGVWYLTVNGQAEVNTGISDRNAVSIDVPAAKATRTALQGYQLGDQQLKPLASEAEVIALRDRVAALEAAIGQGLNGNY